MAEGVILSFWFLNLVPFEPHFMCQQNLRSTPAQIKHFLKVINVCTSKGLLSIRFIKVI